MLKKATTQSPLDNAIAKALTELDTRIVGSSEYAEVLKSVEKLYAIRSSTTPAPVSLDTIFAGTFSLTSVLSVLAFEKLGHGVITTKAMGLLNKPKI